MEERLVIPFAPILVESTRSIGYVTRPEQKRQLIFPCSLLTTRQTTPPSIQRTKKIRPPSMPLSESCWHCSQKQTTFAVQTAYDKIAFCPGKRQYFQVNADFPCIRQDSLPLGVSGVNYLLSLSAIASFLEKQKKHPVPSTFLSKAPGAL